MKKILSVLLVFIMTLSLMTVSVSAATLKLNTSNVSLPIGYSTTLKVSGSKGTVKWSSADSTVAAIKSTDGASAKISAKKTGQTYIYAKTGGKTLKCKVTVKKSFITASQSLVELEPGKSGTVTITAKGSKDLTITNSNKDVCSVSLGKWNGNKAKLTVKSKAEGVSSIKIYAKGYSKSTTAVITVRAVEPKKNNNSGSNSSSDNSYEISFGFGFDVDNNNFYYTDNNSNNDTGSDNSNDYASTDSSSQSMIDQVVDLVNAERRSAGLSALASNGRLNEIAALRAEEITRLFDHTRPDGTVCFTAFTNITYSAAGENIAAGQRSAEEVMDDWMNSPGHRANILSDNFGKIGVGCYKYGGMYYWVQVFTD
ncbi:MAG: hypothetical protein J1F11_11445 [Oscillospiraceae bacterium]|nr:hypothetical protein [Oscillospiraceae bacterium]